MPNPSRFERRQIVGLDGLRAIAALAVIVFHVWPGSLTGGFLGVDVFFVLSGFLITSLLIAEYRRTDTLDLAQFWLRRLRRLMPALIVCVAGTVPFALLAGADAYVALRRQLLGIFTYTYNWLEIAFGGNYFDGRIPLLYTNVWSLAVEEQFYLVWPLFVFLLLRRPGVRWLTPLALGLASIVAMMAHYVPGENPNRVYMGTDTHAFGLMLGAWLAFVVPTALVGELRPCRLWLDRTRAGLGWLGLAAIIAALVVITGDETWMFPWGLVWTTGASAAVVQALLPNVTTAGGLRRMLNLSVLRWLGERSYGLYLWHWPVWVILVNYFPLANPWLVGAVAVLVTVGAASASYRWIETPIRRHGWRAAFASLRVWTRGRFPGDVHRFAAVTMAVAVSLASVGVAAFTSSDKNTVQQAFEIPPTPTSTISTSSTPSPTTSPTPVKRQLTGKMVTVIGDSVTKMAEPDLANLLPGIAMDSKVSRSSRVVLGLMKNLEKDNDLREFVVVAVATNAKILDSEMESFLEFIGPNRKLVMVTGFATKREVWVEQSNDVIAEWAKKEPQRIIVADWAKAIEGHIDWLYGDKTHPKDAGAKLYAEVLRQAIEARL